MPLIKRTTPAANSGEEENPYLLSFSDIMAGLLAIFILALITLMIRLDQQTQKAEQEAENAQEQAVKAEQQAQLAEQTRDQVHMALAELARVEEMRRDMLQEIKKRLSKHNIQVEISDNHSVLRIPDQQLHFASGSYEIPADKRETLTLIGKVLEQALRQAKRLEFIETIFIEGHTDSQPFSYHEMGNWGLSAYRAIAVWKYWTEGELKGFLRLRNRFGRPLFSVSGYAATRRLILPDLDAATRQQNRRIDLRFTMRAPMTGDLMRMLEKFKAAGIE
jgi:flagellar motor protein MotB